MAHKKRSLGILLGLMALLSTIGLAAWLVATSSGFTASVVSTSSSPVVFSTEFSDFELNTTTSNASDSTVAVLTNDNGELDLDVALNISKVDVDDDCESFEEDCDVSVYLEGVAFLNDGDNVHISGGDMDVTAEVICQKLACPQNIEVSLTLTG